MTAECTAHCDCGIEPLAGGYSLEVVLVSKFCSRRRLLSGITEYGRFGRPIDGILSIKFDISSVAALMPGTHRLRDQL